MQVQVRRGQGHHQRNQGVSLPRKKIRKRNETRVDHLKEELVGRNLMVGALRKAAEVKSLCLCSFLFYRGIEILMTAHT